MEDKSTTTFIIPPTTPTAGKYGKTPPRNVDKNNKKRGPFALFRSATHLIMRRRPEKKPKTEVSSWKKIVGSIRPFHLQDNQSPRPSAHSIGRSDDMSIPLPSSPQAITNRSSFSISDDGTSQYPPTTNLPELEKGSESQNASAVKIQAVAKQGEADDGISNNNVGDEMIDSKAEEFIEKFYLQIRGQDLEKVEHHNEMMAARG